MGAVDGIEVNADVRRYPNRDLIGLARNIVNQILDESGVDVTTRQRINDDCDRFTHDLIAARLTRAWDEGEESLWLRLESAWREESNPYRKGQS